MAVSGFGQLALSQSWSAASFLAACRPLASPTGFEPMYQLALEGKIGNAPKRMAPQM